jgi:diguanylate cyclase (GGDEF)-like protein/PAS domain S-box-containing protein
MGQPHDPLNATAATRTGPWRRVHASLMPDYNHRASVAWWAGFGLGSVVLAWAAAGLALQGAAVAAQAALALLLAVLAAMFPVRVPGTRHSYAAGDILIFLALLALGPAAAALVAAGDAFVGSLRSSRRWTSRLFSPASAALAMVVAGLGLQALMNWARAQGHGDVPLLMAGTMAFSLVYCAINVALVTGVLQLKRGEPFWQPRALLRDYRWVAMAYAGSAAMATLLFVTWQSHGAGALLVMLPLLAMLLATLHFYFRQQEATEQLLQASADATRREQEQAAASAAREAEAARAHLLALERSERRFHSAFTHASIGMALLGFDGRILQANPALAALVGRNAEALAGAAFAELVYPEERGDIERALGLVAGSEFQAFARELRCLHAGGGSVWLALHASFFTEPGAAEPCLILQAQDVSARRVAEAGLQHMAFHDALTGLPNRRRFMECLASAVARSRNEPRHAWAVMFIDFDRFKLVNDSLGHQAGDELLQQLARRVQEKLRPADTVARLGGDEFAILVENLEHERDAVVLAERLMESLRTPFRVGGEAVTSSASIGITFSAFGYEGADAVLRDADTAMYRAKAEGKARYAVFDSGLHQAVSQRLRLEGELRGAVAAERLSVVYQPLFQLGTDRRAHRLVGFEALLRWRQADGSLREPAQFLPVAEEAGLMRDVTDFVLHCACQQLAQWQRSSPELAELGLSVNIGAQDLRQADLVARVSRALVEAGLKPQHLTLELTEDILMDTPALPAAVAHETMRALRSLGVQLAVDDFGTGYSNLSRLSTLPIDSLKIDRSFVRQLRSGGQSPNEREQAAAVVAAIVQLGSTLRKAVVAEGIESAEQVEQLRGLGCELGQGFHLASPLAAGDATDWLAARGAPLH